MANAALSGALNGAASSSSSSSKGGASSASAAAAAAASPAGGNGPASSSGGGGASSKILFLVVLYATCSSSLSIVNKWAILALPFPGIVTACQFFATACSVYGLGKTGVLKVEPLERQKLVRMAPINVIFYLAIFTNGKVLQFSTVETFIAFRSLTPLLVAFLDTLVRSEPSPSVRTLGCLFAIATAAAAYAARDANFSPVGYAWASAYLAVIVTEMVYAKHITATIGLSTWGLVLYQNTIALFLFPIASFFSGEFSQLARLLASGANTQAALVGVGVGVASTPGDVVDATGAHPALTEAAPTQSTHAVVVQPYALVPVLLSCVLGVGISFAGWGTRSSISATQFTVLGVACKLATVAINLLVWNHHAPLHAQIAIVLCIVASVAYQQSARRDKAVRERTFVVAHHQSLPKRKNTMVVVDDDEETDAGGTNIAGDAPVAVVVR